jgi:phage baseplate assembly protein W
MIHPSSVKVAVLNYFFTHFFKPLVFGGFLFTLILLMNIFISMAVTYGIDFPFRESPTGDYLKMTATPEREVRANLIHLILTKKGSRYYLPDFGTRIYEYIFDQNDMITFNLIEEEIREGCKKYLPNLDINSIKVISAEDDTNPVTTVDEDDDERLFRLADDQY